MRARTVASVSVFRSTVIVAPFTVNDPDATLANWLVLASTCWSSRMLPRTVLAVASFAAVRNPLVSPPTVIRSSLFAVVVSFSLSCAESYAAVTPAPAALMRLMIELSVSVFLFTLIATPFTVKDPEATAANCDVFARTCWSSRMLPRVVVAAASLTALSRPDVSFARTMSSSEFAVVVSVILSFANAAVTPAADALMREMTALIESFAFTAMLVPLIVNDPAVTWALFSKRGRRLGSASLNVAAGSTSVLLWLTVVAAVWLLVSDPAENEIESPTSAPRETWSPALMFALKLKRRVLFWSRTSKWTFVATSVLSAATLFLSFTVSDVAFAAVLTPV